MSVTYEINRFETCPDYTSAGIVIICSVMLLSAVVVLFWEALKENYNSPITNKLGWATMSYEMKGEHA